MSRIDLALDAIRAMVEQDKTTRRQGLWAMVGIAVSILILAASIYLRG